MSSIPKRGSIEERKETKEKNKMFNVLKNLLNGLSIQYKISEDYKNKDGRIQYIFECAFETKSLFDNEMVNMHFDKTGSNTIFIATNDDGDTLDFYYINICEVKDDRNRFLEIINEINRKSVLATLYIANNSIICFNRVFSFNLIKNITANDLSLYILHLLISISMLYDEVKRDNEKSK